MTKHEFVQSYKWERINPGAAVTAQTVTVFREDPSGPWARVEYTDAAGWELWRVAVWGRTVGDDVIATVVLVAGDKIQIQGLRAQVVMRWATLRTVLGEGPSAEDIAAAIMAGLAALTASEAASAAAVTA